MCTNRSIISDFTKWKVRSNLLIEHRLIRPSESARCQWITTHQLPPQLHPFERIISLAHMPLGSLMEPFWQVYDLSFPLGDPFRVQLQQFLNLLMTFRCTIGKLPHTDSEHASLTFTIKKIPPILILQKNIRRKTNNLICWHCDSP